MPRARVTSSRPKRQRRSSRPRQRVGTTEVPVVVAIGASAGGLQALERFLGHVPKASGLAFVVLQHLDPTRPGLLPELLQRATPMKVEQAGDQARVAPDHVYVIPPNRDLSILGGFLHLLEPAAPRGLRLPIDLFFRALAADQGPRSVGVVLSGMGTDGTLGLRAIKEKAAWCLCRTRPRPRSTACHGVPLNRPRGHRASRGDAGRQDHRLPPPRPPYGQARTGREGRGHNAFEKVVILLRSQTGHDFSLYKKTRCIAGLSDEALHQIDQIGTYVRFLQENPHRSWSCCSRNS